MIKDPSITTLAKKLEESGYKFILIAEKTGDTSPTSRESTIKHSIDSTLTNSLVALAATFARKAKEDPELMQFLRITNGYINDTDDTFLNKNVPESRNNSDRIGSHHIISPYYNKYEN